MQNKHRFQKVDAYKIRKACSACRRMFVLGTKAQIYCPKCAKTNRNTGKTYTTKP